MADTTTIRKQNGEIGKLRCGSEASLPTHKRWLTVPEAAIELGVSASTVRTLCNARPPKIEHKREGTWGRGCRGTILIDRAIIEAHNQRQAYRPATPRAVLIPQPRIKRRPIVNPYW